LTLTESLTDRAVHLKCVAGLVVVLPRKQRRMLACFGARKAILGEHAVTVDAPQGRFYVEEGGEEEKAAGLFAAAGGGCLRYCAQEPDEWPFQVDVSEPVHPPLNEFIPVCFPERIARGGNTVNRPMAGTARNEEVIQQTAVALESPNQPHDCVCPGIGGSVSLCLLVEPQFHGKHNLDRSSG
jgi:hypothetical protein